jgi:MoxR-like ATPase
MVPPQSPMPNRSHETLLATVAAMRQEIHKCIIGQQRVLDEILIALLAGGHALLVGVPGLAKTLMIRSVPGRCTLIFDVSSSLRTWYQATSRARR